VLLARAFVSGRDFHGTHHANSDFNTHVEASLAPASVSTSTCTFTSSVKMQPYAALPAIVFSLDGHFEHGGHWYNRFQYPIERERGLDFEEDAWCPGRFEWKLSAERPTANLVVSTDEVNVEEARETRKREIGRRRALAQVLERDSSAEADNVALSRLARAADQFIVRRRDGLHTVLAGYPWFGDWGRDTMIALPGLCLSTGRSGEALSILLAFSQAMSKGMIPNRFPDAGEVPDYNTIDATMWFFHAVERYLKLNPEDCAAMQTLYPALKESLEWHWKGTRFNIQADEEDGLLSGGDAHTQLTWMDAKIGDTAFTPRWGKPVEIQALWYNALCTGAKLAEQMEDKPFATKCAAWSRKVKTNFPRLFWNEETDCLFDFINENEKNAQIRPNQIFALSLPERLLPLDKEKKILRVVECELLTPRGMRSLSPSDPQYRGIYQGDPWSRDSAYHQGTVWGWPIGALCSAFGRVYKWSPRAKTLVRAWLQPMIEHLDEAGLGTISEVFDGDAPHTPRGCPAQAWSVSEVLRVLDELQQN
jgi:predicted glycogen debranching enzyme